MGFIVGVLIFATDHSTVPRRAVRRGRCAQSQIFLDFVSINGKNGTRFRIAASVHHLLSGSRCVSKYANCIICRDNQDAQSLSCTLQPGRLWCTQSPHESSRTPDYRLSGSSTALGMARTFQASRDSVALFFRPAFLSPNGVDSMVRVYISGANMNLYS